MPDLTPMVKQYQEIKASHKDAELASRELDLPCRQGGGLKY
jgi:DNA mismatch repair ATPase MutS